MFSLAKLAKIAAMVAVVVFGTCGVSNVARAQEDEDAPPQVELPDNFRPVWQQELQQQQARRAQEARHVAAERARDQQHKQQATVPIRATTVNFGSWLVVCRQILDGKSQRSCRVALHVLDAKSRLPVLVWSIIPDTGRGLRSEIEAPTGLRVSAGLELKLGETPPVKLDYFACTSQSCLVREAGNTALVEKIMTSSVAQFVLQTRDGQVLTIKTPINGFEKAIAEARS